MPEEGASFAPEVTVHKLLRARQVPVPEIIHFEACNALLGRSIMVAREIPGRPLSQSVALGQVALERIAAAAGQDLRLIHDIPVAGFGWVRRAEPAGAPLRAEWPTHRAFGAYTGVIDFGEIRGTSQWYDLGHFHLRDGEQLPFRLLPALLRGYTAGRPLPPDTETQVRFASLLINVCALARALRRRPPDRALQHRWTRLRKDLAVLG